jgi:hypothetical protein
MHSRIGRTIACGVLGFLVGGCEISSTKTRITEEDAKAYVSAYPPVRWAAIADKLEPKHNISAEQARAMVIQTTLAETRYAESRQSVGLTLGASPVSSAAQSASTPLLNMPGINSVDANAQLTAATALYQQAQILDHQISNQHLPEGYEAHLITFQVNLQPMQRDLAADAYVNIALRPSTWSLAVETAKGIRASAADLSPVIVQPLIITDALETASIGQSIEATRQAGLQLSSDLAFHAGLAGSSDRRDHVVGLDKNGLITVGRVNDHTLQLRLGAQNSGNSRYALTPRSYNISALVLTRWDPGTSAAQVRELSVVTKTALRTVKDGAYVAPTGARRPDRLAAAVQKMLGQYGFKAERGPCRPIETGTPDDFARNSIERPLGLLRAVDRSDYDWVNACLQPLTANGENLTGDARRAREDSLYRLLQQLDELQVGSRYSTFVIPLEPPQNVASPQSQNIALMTDDGDQISVVLGGGSALKANRLRASLVLASGKILMARSIQVSPDGSEVTASFPSVAAIVPAQQARQLRLERFSQSHAPVSEDLYDLASVRPKARR